MDKNDGNQELEKQEFDEYDFDGYDFLLVAPPEIFEEAEKEAEQLYQEILRRIQLASHSSGDEAEKETSNKKLETIGNIPEDASLEEITNSRSEMDELESQSEALVSNPESITEPEREEQMTREEFNTRHSES